MNIQEQFNLVAKEYDSNRKKFIPCFDDYYKSTTDFIAENIEKPKKIHNLNQEKLDYILDNILDIESLDDIKF